MNVDHDKNFPRSIEKFSYLSCRWDRVCGHWKLLDLLNETRKVNGVGNYQSRSMNKTCCRNVWKCRQCSRESRVVAFDYVSIIIRMENNNFVCEFNLQVNNFHHESFRTILTYVARSNLRTTKGQAVENGSKNARENKIEESKSLKSRQTNWNFSFSFPFFFSPCVFYSTSAENWVLREMWNETTIAFHTIHSQNHIDFHIFPTRPRTWKKITTRKKFHENIATFKVKNFALCFSSSVSFYVSNFHRK